MNTRAWSVLLRKVLSNRRLTVAAVVAIVLAVLALISRFGGDEPRGTDTGASSVTAATAGTRPGSVAPGLPTTRTPGSPGATPTQPGDPDSSDDPDDDQPVQPVDAARQAGIDWIASWLNTTGTNPQRWLARLEDRTTPELAEDLTDVDLATIPVGRIGAVTATPASAGLVDVAAAVVDPAGKTVGTVTVTMAAAGGGWKAASVDWEPVR